MTARAEDYSGTIIYFYAGKSAGTETRRDTSGRRSAVRRLP